MSGVFLFPGTLMLLCPVILLNHNLREIWQQIVVNQFSRVAANERCSFFGNVSLGNSVSLLELREIYDVVSTQQLKMQVEIEFMDTYSHILCWHFLLSFCFCDWYVHSNRWCLPMVLKAIGLLAYPEKYVASSYI